jgi:hypothetical protein
MLDVGSWKLSVCPKAIGRVCFPVAARWDTAALPPRVYSRFLAFIRG